MDWRNFIWKFAFLKILDSNFKVLRKYYLLKDDLNEISKIKGKLNQSIKTKFINKEVRYWHFDWCYPWPVPVYLDLDLELEGEDERDEDRECEDRDFERLRLLDFFLLLSSSSLASRLYFERSASSSSSS